MKFSFKGDQRGQNGIFQTSIGFYLITKGTDEICLPAREQWLSEVIVMTTKISQIFKFSFCIYVVFLVFIEQFEL